MIKFCQRVAERQNTVKWTQSALCLSHTCKVRESSDYSTFKKLTTQHSSIRTVTYNFSNAIPQLQIGILLTTKYWRALLLKRISDTFPSHDTCCGTERNPLCIANYKQKGKRNSELLIPIPGPPLQGHSSVIANKEIAIPNQTQCAPFTLKTNVHIFSYNREAATERRPST
jgi:hypothetical protein